MDGVCVRVCVCVEATGAAGPAQVAAEKLLSLALDDIGGGASVPSQVCLCVWGLEGGGVSEHGRLEWGEKGRETKREREGKRVGYGC